VKGTNKFERTFVFRIEDAGKLGSNPFVFVVRSSVLLIDREMAFDLYVADFVQAFYYGRASVGNPFREVIALTLVFFFLLCESLTVQPV